MAVVSRLKKSGDLYTFGEIDELSPQATDGLLAHWPLDNASCSGVNFTDRNMLNYRTWKIGSTGAQPGFNENADTAGENAIVSDYDPFGVKTAIWQAKPVALGNADGGWNTPGFPIDRTKTYRVSVWIRRTVIGAGSFYHGACWYGSDQLLTLSGVSAVNPYFEYGTISTTEWRLYVGHIWASSKGDSTVHADTGIYNRKGKQAGGEDFKWTPSATTGACRSYLFYCSDASTTQQFCYPRFEVVDGTEPSIRQLLTGEGYSLSPVSLANVNVTEDGVAIESPTSNLAPWGAFSSQSFSTDEGTATILPYQGVNGRNAVRVYKAPGMTYGNWQLRNPFPEAISSGTTYTASVKYKAQEGCMFSVGDWGGPNGNVPNWPVVRDSPLENGWRLRVCSITYNSSGTAQIFGINSTTPGKWVIFSDLQLERSTFYSSFTATSHAAGSLTLPMAGFVGETGGISFEFFLEKKHPTNVCLLEGSQAGFRVYVTPQGELAVVEPDKLREGKAPGTVSPNEWHTATVSWNSGRMSVGLDSSISSPVDTDGTRMPQAVKSLRVGPISSPQYARFRNVSVFSVELSASDRRSLAKSMVKFSGSWKLSPRKLIESRIVKADWFYFPMGSDCLDITRQVSPTRADNLAFEDSAVWVGTAATNLSNNGSGLWTNNGGSFVDYGNVGPNGTRKWKFTKTGSASQWHGWESVVSGNFAAGSKFTFSFYSKNETIGMGWAVCAYVPDWSRNLSTWAYGQYNQGPAWKKHVGIVTFNEACTSFITCDGPSWNYTTSPGSCEFAGLMWEAKGFPSPFCKTSRGSGALAYNLYSSIGLNWSGNWTIAYWKKPIATHTDARDGYNLESIGSNLGTGGAPYYAWWGKQHSVDTIVGPQSSPTNSWGTYFGEWQFVVLRKSGGTLSVETRGVDFTAKASSTSVPTTPSACVNPGWNYDLMLGGWDNSNSVNAFYRDLIVAKYALTDAEVNAIYSQARLIKDGISVPCAFEEGLR